MKGPETLVASRSAATLPEPPSYFPLEKGLYEVAPGLRALEGPAVLLDREFAAYRSNKLACRAERLGKYSLRAPGLEPAVEREAVAWLVERLVAEHPALFAREALDGGGTRLSCALTGETIELDADHELVAAHAANASAPPQGPAYASALDALACQIQEDVAVMHGDRLVALHLCSPSHWSGESKIGKSFFDIHVPVPGIDKINKAAASFAQAMIHKGPYMRFVWGFGSDRRLNHHPEPPPGVDAASWRGRVFDPSLPMPFYLRLERQVTWGLPRVGASMFLIRPFFAEGGAIRSDERKRALLASALSSMTPEALEYKGLSASRDAILAWLGR